LRNLRIYFRILGAHLRSTLEYEADFWIMVAAGVLAAVPAQVMGSMIGLHGFGDILIGGAMFGWAVTHLDVAWSPTTVVIGVILFASAAAVHLSLITMFTLITFWIPGPHPFFAIAMHNVEDMVRYPITIYGFAVRAAFTVLVPFAFVTYFPLAWLLGKSSAWMGLLTPLVAGYCIWLARSIFRRGLLRYDSAGH
jgi:ABC-2 type transport system permease protein